MSNKVLKKHFKRNMLVAVGLALVTPAVFASTTWVGTANYFNAPGSGGDEAIAGPFDTYDFGNGVGAIDAPNFNVGTTFTGYYQTYVTRHELNGVGINLTELNSSGALGSGTGFELTMRATFTGVYTANNGGSVDFGITGGNAALYFDTTPDYSFTADSGFNNDNVILSGNIDNTGSGTLMTQYGFGVSKLNLVGVFGNTAPNVYTPNTIGGGTSLFTINLNNPTVLAGVTQVMGKTSNLYAADGSLQLTAVPVPAAAWLFGSGLIGLITASKRKKSVG